MKTMVIYKSATGFTKKYAQWIAEELSAELFAAREVTLQQMEGYACIIFGGRLYAVGIDGFNLIKKNYERLKGKRLLVFATGASPVSETVIADVRSKNLSVEQQGLIQFFYLRGGFDYAALPLFDKIRMALMKKSIMRKQRKGKALTPDEMGMLKLYDRVSDFTKKEYIQAIVQAAHAQKIS